MAEAVPSQPPGSAASRSPSPLRRRRRQCAAPYVTRDGRRTDRRRRHRRRVRRPRRGARLDHVRLRRILHRLPDGAERRATGSPTWPAAGRPVRRAGRSWPARRRPTECGPAPHGPVDPGPTRRSPTPDGVATCGLGVVAVGSSDTTCAADAQPDAPAPAPIDPALPGHRRPAGPARTGDGRPVPAVARATGGGRSAARSRRPRAGDVGAGDGGCCFARFAAAHRLARCVAIGLVAARSSLVRSRPPVLTCRADGSAVRCSPEPQPPRRPATAGMSGTGHPGRPEAGVPIARGAAIAANDLVRESPLR